MTKTLRPDRPVRREISLPESVDSRIQLLLFSPVEKRVPFGAFSAFFTELAVQALARVPLEPVPNTTQESPTC